MYLLVIAWIYVALMMAVAEATHSNGTVLGAIMTFLLYGVGPMALVVYLLNTPARRKQRRTAEAADGPSGTGAVPPSDAPDGGSETAGDAVAPVRKEP